MGIFSTLGADCKIGLNDLGMAQHFTPGLQIAEALPGAVNAVGVTPHVGPSSYVWWCINPIQYTVIRSSKYHKH